MRIFHDNPPLVLFSKREEQRFCGFFYQILIPLIAGRDPWSVERDFCLNNIWLRKCSGKLISKDELDTFVAFCKNPGRYRHPMQPPPFKNNGISMVAWDWDGQEEFIIDLWRGRMENATPQQLAILHPTARLLPELPMPAEDVKRSAARFIDALEREVERFKDTDPAVLRNPYLAIKYSDCIRMPSEAVCKLLEIEYFEELPPINQLRRMKI